jgi:hypothetical protein
MIALLWIGSLLVVGGLCYVRGFSEGRGLVRFGRPPRGGSGAPTTDDRTTAEGTAAPRGDDGPFAA